MKRAAALPLLVVVIMFVAIAMNTRNLHNLLEPSQLFLLIPFGIFVVLRVLNARIESRKRRPSLPKNDTTDPPAPTWSSLPARPTQAPFTQPSFTQAPTTPAMPPGSWPPPTPPASSESGSWAPPPSTYPTPEPMPYPVPDPMPEPVVDDPVPALNPPAYRPNDPEGVAALPAELVAQLRDLRTGGRTIEAVQLLRDHTGMEVYEASRLIMGLDTSFPTT